MLTLNWPRLLSLFLWISPHVLLGVLAVILCSRRSYREFPCFFAYVLYEIAGFILLFALYSASSVTAEQYAYAYYFTLLFSIALRFGVIEEVSRGLFRESVFLKVAARRSLRCVAGLLLVMGVLLAVYAPGNNSIKLVAGSVVNRGAAMVQCGLLLSLLLFSRFVGLSWRRPAFGIALGLGVLSSVDLAIFALRTEFSSAAWIPYLNWAITGTYFVCVSIWIAYLLAPELEPASLTVVSRDEVENWNTELQHVVRQGSAQQ
jgi:hypothetical protein